MSANALLNILTLFTGLNISMGFHPLLLKLLAK